MNAPNELHRELSAFLDAYFDSWNDYDVGRMRALWDTAEQQVVYVAEECEPHIGWLEIEKYWGVDRSKAVRLLTWRDLTAIAASSDVAVAFFHCNWSTFIPGNRLYPKPFGGPVRITMVLRRRDVGWRAIHYAEAPLASIVQLRRAHEDAVAPELHARLADLGFTY